MSARDCRYMSACDQSAAQLQFHKYDLAEKLRLEENCLAAVTELNKCLELKPATTADKQLNDSKIKELVRKIAGDLKTNISPIKLLQDLLAFFYVNAVDCPSTGLPFLDDITNITDPKARRSVLFHAIKASHELSKLNPKNQVSDESQIWISPAEFFTLVVNAEPTSFWDLANFQDKPALSPLLKFGTSDKDQILQDRLCVSLLESTGLQQLMSDYENSIDRSDLASLKARNPVLYPFFTLDSLDAPTEFRVTLGYADSNPPAQSGFQIHNSVPTLELQKHFTYPYSFILRILWLGPGFNTTDWFKRVLPKPSTEETQTAVSNVSSAFAKWWATQNDLSLAEREPYVRVAHYCRKILEQRITTLITLARTTYPYLRTDDKFPSNMFPDFLESAMAGPSSLFSKECIGDASRFLINLYFILQRHNNDYEPRT